MPSTIQTPQETGDVLVPIESLIGQAASFIGGADDPRVKEQALMALDRAARRMNMSGFYLFNLVNHQYTTTSSPALTNGATELSTPSDFGWPADPVTAKNSDGHLISYLEWLPWEVFESLNASSSFASVPAYLSIKNETENKVYVYPAVGTNNIDILDMAYYRRIQKPSEARSGSTLYLPDETLECLLTGAEYFIIRHRHKDDPRIAASFLREFQTTIHQARASASRRQQAFHTMMRPDETGHMPTNPYTFSGRGTAFIPI